VSPLWGNALSTVFATERSADGGPPPPPPQFEVHPDVVVAFSVKLTNVEVVPDGKRAHSVQLPSDETPFDWNAGNIPVVFQLPFASVTPAGVLVGVQPFELPFNVPQIWNGVLVTCEASASVQASPTKYVPVFWPFKRRMDWVDVGVPPDVDVGLIQKVISVDVAPDGNKSHSAQAPSVELPFDWTIGNVPVAFQLPFEFVVWVIPEKSVAVGVQVVGPPFKMPQTWKPEFAMFDVRASAQASPTKKAPVVWPFIVSVGWTATGAGFSVKLIKLDVAPDGKRAHSVQLPSDDTLFDWNAGKVPVVFQLPFASVTPAGVLVGVQPFELPFNVPQIWNGVLVTFDERFNVQAWPTT
jgi:hypothetical protein